MQIVIDIPDKIYNDLQSRREANVADINTVFGAISGGIPLPKGHGDLVERKCKNKFCRDCVHEDVCYRLDASVIIPADKGE